VALGQQAGDDGIARLLAVVAAVPLDAQRVIDVLGVGKTVVRVDVRGRDPHVGQDERDGVGRIGQGCGVGARELGRDVQEMLAVTPEAVGRVGSADGRDQRLENAVAFAVAADFRGLLERIARAFPLGFDAPGTR